MTFWEWLTSAAVLETTFDGFLGAAIGALVAVVVLKVTLREQSEGLAAQLARQDAHHQEQLATQREENKRERIHAAAATIIDLLVQLHPASRIPENAAAIVSIGNALYASITRLRLDTNEYEEGFCEILSARARRLVEHALSLSQTGLLREQDKDHYEMVTQIQRDWVVRFLLDWVRGSAESRQNIDQILRGSLGVEKEYGGRYWQVQFAPDTIADIPK